MVKSITRSPNFIPVYEPCLNGNEETYLLDALRTGWISSLGGYVRRFEGDFAKFCGTAHGVSVSSGTAALHLALHALGVGPGDEVIVPALTFVASASAVLYTGASPVFVDVDPLTWTIDPTDVERNISSRTRAIIAVHLYGHPAPMTEINVLAEQNGLWVVEDAAEGHGAALNGQRVGSLGHIAAFSFYANKVMTTGEGGMLTTNDERLADRCRLLRDHAMSPRHRYWHEEIGFNYRMTNLQAAIGVAQMERIDEFIQRKRQIADLYRTALSSEPGVTLPVELTGCTNVYWMYSLLIEHDFPLTRNELIVALRDRGIDSRRFFHSLDTLPPFRIDTPCQTALALSKRGINLPSSPVLRDEQVSFICETLCELARQ